MRNSEISRLRQKNTKKKSEVLRLHQESTTKDTEISQLRQANTTNVSDSSEVLRLRQEVVSLAAEHNSKIREDVEKIGGLKARVDQLQKSSDYYTAEALRLTTENLQMKSQNIYPNGVPGKL